jgi:hypothetical protein
MNLFFDFGVITNNFWEFVFSPVNYWKQQNINRVRDQDK